MSQQLLTDQPEAQHPSQQRRRLLKASATLAPLIATLPCGSDVAASSVSQCLKESRTLSNSYAEVPPAAPNIELAGAGTDSCTPSIVDSIGDFQRYRGRVYVYTDTAPGGLPPKPFYYIAPTWYDEAGVPLDHDALVALGYDSPAPGPADGVETHLLCLYRLEPNDTDPTGFVPCSTTGGQCIWPLASRESFAGGNTGIAASCLASFLPAA